MVHKLFGSLIQQFPSKGHQTNMRCHKMTSESMKDEHIKQFLV